jgi:hypothetical protein
MAEDLRFFLPTVEEARGLREVSPVERQIASIKKIPRSPEIEAILNDLMLEQGTIPGVPVEEWTQGLMRGYAEEGAIPQRMQQVISESPQRGASWLHGERGLQPERAMELEAALSRLRTDRTAGQAARDAEIEAIRSRPPVQIIPTGTAPLSGRDERIRRQREVASAEALRRQKLNEEVQMMSRTPLTLERQLAALDLLRD